MISVLYIDDEPDLLEMGKLYLEQSGEFVIETLTSAQAALELLNKKNYDAIVSDYQMPKMNGIDFLKKFRVTDTTTPFIIFTGRGREEVVIEALNNGADFYLQKGGDPNTLYMELSHVIRQSVLMRRTQMTLAEQEQRYHDLQNANDLIQSVVPDGHFLFVNKRWLDTLGYSEHELPNLTIFDIIHEESLNHCMETFQRVISGENVGIIDAVFKTRDGKRVYVEGIADCKIVEGKPQYTRGLFKDVTDRKLAEAALRESEARYRDVVEDQTELICRFRPDGTHVFVNDAYCRYFKKTREEIIGKRFAPPIHDEDRALITQHLASLTPDHPVAMVSNRIILQDGRIRWQQWSNRATFDDEGRLLEYQSVGRDITDLKEAEQELYRKNEDINAAFEELTATEEELRHNYDLLSQKEQALRESGDTFRAMVEQSSEGIIIVDFFGMLQFANYRAWDIIEYPENRRTTTDFNVLEIVSPELRLSAVRDFAQVAAGIDSYIVNYKILTHDKKEKWIECIGKKISFTGSAAMLLSFRDITERQHAEMALRESEGKFRALFENANDAITVLGFTPEGMPSHFTHVNENACRLSGYARNEMLSMSPKDLDDPEEWTEARGITQKIMEQGHLVFERFLVRKDGKKIPIEISTHVFILNNQNVMLSIFRDITERKREEDALRQANKKLNLLSSITRHDINNQLLTLNGFVGMLHKKIPDPSFEDYFSRIKKASSQITAMIRFTKEYEKIGIHAPVWQNIRALVDNAGKSATLGQVRLENDLSPGMEVFADPLITKVFINLIDNAIRHGGKITTIRFYSEERNGNRIIVCEDDGDGVAMEEKETIFERGFGKNTGFGLTISRDILDITGITIKETGEPGKGAQFEMTVPRGMWRIAGKIA